jgi:hypothetical protein
MQSGWNAKFRSRKTSESPCWGVRHLASQASGKPSTWQAKHVGNLEPGELRAWELLDCEVDGDIRSGRCLHGAVHRLHRPRKDSRERILEKGFSRKNARERMLEKECSRKNARERMLEKECSRKNSREIVGKLFLGMEFREYFRI